MPRGQDIGPTPKALSGRAVANASERCTLLYCMKTVLMKKPSGSEPAEMEWSVENGGRGIVSAERLPNALSRDW